jgi:hypothetical protein
MEKTYIDKLALIEIRDRKVLETCSYGKDKRYIPGGKRDEVSPVDQLIFDDLKKKDLID